MSTVSGPQGAEGKAGRPGDAPALDQETDSLKLANGKGEGSSDETSSSDDESATKTAPIQLMAEFISSIRGGKWVIAKKLCTMILMYEAENPEAKAFKLLIDERIEMDKKAELTESEASSGSEEEEDESSSDSEEEKSNSDDDDGGDGEEAAESSDESSDEDRSEHIKNPLCFPEQWRL